MIGLERLQGLKKLLLRNDSIVRFHKCQKEALRKLQWLQSKRSKWKIWSWEQGPFEKKQNARRIDTSLLLQKLLLVNNAFEYWNRKELILKSVCPVESKNPSKVATQDSISRITKTLCNKKRLKLSSSQRIQRTEQIETQTITRGSMMMWAFPNKGIQRSALLKTRSDPNYRKIKKGFYDSCCLENSAGLQLSIPHEPTYSTKDVIFITVRHLRSVQNLLE